MKFKNLISVVVVIILTVDFISCTNLVSKETDSIVKNSQVGFTAGNPEALLSSAYKDLAPYQYHGNVFALGEVPTAELVCPTRGVDWSDNGVWRELEQHTWSPTQRFVINVWNILNGYVYKLTVILASNPTPAQKAEAQFLRAFHMFRVMDFYGQVPYREVTQGINDLPKVMTRSEAFDYIVKDLTEALPNLRTEGPGTAPKNGFANKAAANFLLAKLYLNKAVYKAANSAGPYTFDKADMEKVISCADAITSDGYSLDPDYFSAFSNKSRFETIFVSTEGTPQNQWFMSMHFNQNPAGYNGFTTLASFYDKFEDGDIRKGRPGKRDGTLYSGAGVGFMIGQQYDDNGKPLVDTRTLKPLVFTREVPLFGATTTQGIRVLKYHRANYGQYMFMRYGEVALMKAEAQFRGADAASAMATLNDLRAVRKESLLTSLSSDELFDEIGRETYWEGCKRTVEVRFGKFTSGEGVTNKAGYTVLYPIPAVAIVANPNLKQNPGY